MAWWLLAYVASFCSSPWTWASLDVSFALNMKRQTQRGGSWCRLFSSSAAWVVGNDSCLPQWTLICYCSTAAVRHAADSRWQPGRNGGWGSWRGKEREEEGEGKDRSMWHMWVAVGGEDGDDDAGVYACTRIDGVTAFPASIQILCL